MGICGASRSGKTKTFIDVARAYKAKYRGAEVWLISPTATTDPIWKKRCNYSLIDRHFDTFDDVTIEAVRGRMATSSTTRSEKRGRLLLGVDDMGEDTRVGRSIVNNPLRELYVAAVQNEIDLVFLIQRLTQAPPILRDNFEFLVMKKIRSEHERKMFVAEYMSGMSRKRQQDIMRSAWREAFDSLCVIRVRGGGTIYKRNFTELIYDPETDNGPLRPEG